MARIAEIQTALREEGLDGWLFFDHHHRDPLAYRVLQFEPAQTVTRRWYYLVPATGEPRGMVHKIESEVLNSLPGTKTAYAGWAQQVGQLADLLRGCGKVAMQYSPNCSIPYVSNIDAGTLELVLATGVTVQTSANLIQLFEARWTEAQYAQHKRAGVLVDEVRRNAFLRVFDALRSGSAIGEWDVAAWIMEQFDRVGLIIDHPPIVGANGNASNPHYAPSAATQATIAKGDLLLIDLWGKLKEPGAVYYDITWMGYCGSTPPAAMQNVFEAVTGARDAAVSLVQQAAKEGRELAGFEVDDAARGHLRGLGLAEHFFHRTGHSIGEEVHGNGANMDNLETHDERKVIPGTCFSVEPGVYLPEFGVRSEVNVFRGTNFAGVTGEIQTALLTM